MRRSILLVTLALAGCATVQPSRALTTDADHKRFNLMPGRIEPWEDGLRTDPTVSGNWEWWYLDGHLDDGSTLVVVFFTKPIDGADGPLRPMVRVDLNRPDGTKVTRLVEVDPSTFSSAKDTCNVRAGANRFEGDLHTYRIHLALPELSGDITLTGEVAPWRPGAGVITFGAKDEKYFAWLPSVPHGTLEGSLTIGGAAPLNLKGSGYHDHNWGNASLAGLVHDWYWGRARVGEYSIIAAYITSEAQYGTNHFPLMLVAKGDQVLVGDSANVTFTSDDFSRDETTQKPLASKLLWEFKDPTNGKRVRVSFHRQKTLMHFALAEQLPAFTRFLASLAGFDGAYHRFTGEVGIEVLEGDTRVDEQHHDAAVWELMYLGKAP
ncbi:MAG: lipocalin-like domain-containing protein [Archangium sp.]